MTALVSAQCPNCGAYVDLDPTATQAVCRFCNTTSLVERAGRPHPPADPHHAAHDPRFGGRAFVIHAQPIQAMPIRSSGGGLPLALTVGGILLAMGAVGAGMWFYGSVRSSPQPPKKAAAGRTVEAPEPIPAARNKPNLWSSGRPLVHDVNGDGVRDVIVWMNGSFTALNGKDGAELWSAPSKGDRHQAFASISGKQLVEVSGVSIAIIDLQKGALEGEVTLEDKAVMPCDLGPAFAGVLLADDDVAKIDLGTRRITMEKRGSCREAESDLARRPSVVSRKYLPPDEVSAAVEAVSCGGVNVTGTYNYVLPDPCGPKAGAQLSSLGDFEPDLLITTKLGFLVIGKKAKGMKYPVAARIDKEKNKVVWNNTIASAPKTNEAGLAPVALSASGDHFAGIYSVDGKQRLHSASIESGVADFDVALDEQVSYLAAGTDGWILMGRDFIDVADARDGKARRIYGWK